MRSCQQRFPFLNISILALWIGPLFSLPQGFKTCEGNGELNLSSPTAAEIICSDNAILDWSDFSIEENESVRFTQPHSQATVLNRVIEANPSRLLGRLEANGTVLLMNNYGILIGEQAQIHTGSFIASALDLNTEVRLRGKIFCRSGKVSLNGGKVIIDGFGRIDAQHGSIALNGDEIFVGPNAALSANGMEAGNGGTISLISQGLTRYYGHSDVAGGALSGDGGFIEISGRTVVFEGTADRTSAFGKAGMLLLDPTDINIQVINPTSGAFLAGNYVPAGASDFINTTIGPNDLLTALAGGDVTISTASAFAAPFGGRITLTAPMSWPANNLTLIANTDILINESLSCTGIGNITLQAAGSVQIGGAQLAPAEVAATTGDIIITAANNVSLLGFGGFYSNVRTQTGSINVTATSGFVQLLADTTNDNFAQIGSPNVTVAGQTVTAPISITAGGNLLLTSPSGANRNYAQIGHGTASVLFPVLDGAFVGNISLSIGGQAILSANASPSGYAQIGHRTGDAAAVLPTNCTGDITGTIQGALTLTSGSAAFAYTHIGHYNSTDNLGQFRGLIDLTLGGPFTLTAGTAANTASQIGYRLRGSLPLDLLSDLVRVTSTSALPSTLTAGPIGGASAVIGGFITNVVANAGNLITDTIVRTTGNLTLTGGSNASVAAAMIGMFFNGGAAVDANTNITIDCLGDLTLQSAATGSGNAVISNRGFIFVSSAFTTNITARNLNMINTSSNPNASVPIISHGPLTIVVAQDINLSRTNANGVGSGIVGGGGMDITAGNDINLFSTGNFAFFGGARISSYAGDLQVRAGNDIVLDGAGGATIPNFNAQISSTDTGGLVEVIAGHDIVVNDGCGIVGIFQTNIVVDDDFPSAPLIGPGSLQLLSGGRIQNTNAGTVDKTNQGLRLFTARQSQNVLSGTLSSGGIDVTGFTGGAFLANTPPELWGVYYFSPFFYLGEVFTIFYKDSLQEITAQAQEVTSEFLYHLNPSQDYPGWQELFSMTGMGTLEDNSDEDPSVLWTKNFYLLRSAYQILNNPKSYTQISR